ncbi:MAG TPA: alpha/beta family hydrolase [Blastocatellia bacterium]|nr:alpha/beta family hydrolase [Blastocatellia bacterium]
MRARQVEINIGSPARPLVLEGELHIPETGSGLVLFAHGSGSSRHSPRNQFVARLIREAGIGTLLFDLLTTREGALDELTRHLRFDIGLLAERLMAVTRRVTQEEETRHLCPGYFGASTGGGAALVAAAQLGPLVGAVVSRGGRPDLAGDALPRVKSPVLLIVGGNDDVVIRLNRQAYEQLRCEKELTIIPGASHLFEEPGTLAEVARVAADWFSRHLRPRDAAAGG